MKYYLRYFFAVVLFCMVAGVWADDHQDATNIQMHETHLMQIGRCDDKNSPNIKEESYTRGQPNLCEKNEILVGIEYDSDDIPTKILCHDANQCIGPTVKDQDVP